MNFQENTVLYFFSTMPQVIGTMLAILGTLYITRFDSVKKELLIGLRNLMIYNDKLLELNKETYIPNVVNLKKPTQELRKLMKFPYNLNSLTDLTNELIKNYGYIRFPEKVKKNHDELIRNIEDSIRDGSVLIVKLKNLKTETVYMFVVNTFILLFFILGFYMLYSFTDTLKLTRLEYIKNSMVIGAIFATYSVTNIVYYAILYVTGNEKLYLLYNFLILLPLPRAWRTKIEMHYFRRRTIGNLPVHVFK